ncbi:MAG: gliding motility-associated ABC transporter substrate-binding protein GldG [Bacteroidota bacterium]|nr:gliding motility-associated ABC transporter substrate-binding protein GldG [Bacteroidota bacterium]
MVAGKIKERQTRPRSRRTAAYLQFAIVLGILIAINIISSLYFSRIDLTEDKRFTVSQPTKELVKKVDDILFIKVYLDAEDLPPGFRKLRDATRDMLDEFRQVGGDNIHYQFINPDEETDPEAKRKLFQQLASQGLQPMNLQVQEDDEFKQKIIIPGATITYQGKTVAVELVEKQLASVPPEVTLHKSTIGLEYQLADGIRRALITDKKKIGFIQGHGELGPLQVGGAADALSNYYEVDFVDLPRYKTGRLDPYEAIIVAKPDSTFTDLEKYKLDQYIMNGGKVLWLVETLEANEDSIARSRLRYALTTDYNLNLVEDFFFRYGVRINYNLVLDLQNHVIGLLMPRYGAQNEMVYPPWPYYVTASPRAGAHPIVNNLNPVWFQYANTIDFVSDDPEVKKTVLLHTSPNTRVLMNPVQINLRTAATLPRERQLYNQGPQIVAALLEGTFSSPFTNRIDPEVMASGAYGQFKAKSVPTKMIFVSDGDVIRSHVSADGTYTEPGFDFKTQQQFGNKSFILNCVDYLTGESSLISLRSKDIKLRLLDTAKIKNEQFYWQVFNLLMPLILLLAFAFIFNYTRKRRFAS